MVAGISHLVVANSNRQHLALCCRHDTFCIGSVGTLSTSSLSFCWRRDHAAGAWPEHSALACQSFRRCPDCRRHVWARPAQLCHVLVWHLGRSAVFNLCAICASYDSVDACLHRTLFLAAVEALFQMGIANPVDDCCPASAACDDWSASRRQSRGPTCRTATMACSKYAANPSGAASCGRRYY